MEVAAKKHATFNHVASSSNHQKGLKKKKKTPADCQQRGKKKDSNKQPPALNWLSYNFKITFIIQNSGKPG